MKAQEFKLENSRLGKISRVVANAAAIPTFLLSPIVLTGKTITGIADHANWQELTDRFGHAINNPDLGSFKAKTFCDG